MSKVVNDLDPGWSRSVPGDAMGGAVIGPSIEHRLIVTATGEWRS